jgi:N-glycosylase/DNA lyase
MVAAATNDLFKRQEAVEEPTRKLSEMPLIGSSFQRKYGGEDADVVYKLATDALQVKATFNEYKNTGKLNEAKEYFQEHRAELAVAPMALQYEKFMGNLRKQEQIIRQSSMPADKKQERIDQLDKQRQLQSERYVQAIKRAEAAIGRTTPQ